MNKVAAVIGPAHGLAGEVTVRLHTDMPQRLVPGVVLTCEGVSHNRLTIAAVRHQGVRTLMRFEEVTDRSGAEALRGTQLLIDASTEPDAWYPSDLKGLRALTPAGHTLGQVADVIFGGAQDLLEITTLSGPVLVPFVHALVPDVNVDGGTITIDPPDGLFPADTSSVQTRDIESK